MRKQVTTHYLQMRERRQLTPGTPAPEGFEVRRSQIPQPELNQFLFRSVGGPWRWYSRLNWDYSEWLAYLTEQPVQTWLAYLQGTPAGYFELLKHDDDSVEVFFIGLMPAFIGKGCGSALLTEAVRAAWQMDASRVWLHTCSEDHPAALGNYLGRGFELYESSTKWEELPDPQDPLWLTAGFVFSSLERHWQASG